MRRRWARGAEDEAAEVDLCAYLAKQFELQALLDSVSACAQSGHGCTLGVH